MDIDVRMDLKPNMDLLSVSSDPMDLPTSVPNSPLPGDTSLVSRTKDPLAAEMPDIHTVINLHQGGSDQAFHDCELGCKGLKTCPGLN